MKVLVIDYGMGNLGSVMRTLQECGAEVKISDDPVDLNEASRLILPGVGSFQDGMKNLQQHGWITPLRKAVIGQQVPLLGICLGMQLLAEKGYEGGETEGLGFIRGEVKRLEPDSPSVRIPHVGWNEVHQVRRSHLFDGIPNGADFYFVHSYQYCPANDRNMIADTPYCGRFASAIASENIYGVQFHPEKSGRMGFNMINNYLVGETHKC